MKFLRILRGVVKASRGDVFIASFEELGIQDLGELIEVLPEEILVWECLPRHVAMFEKGTSVADTVMLAVVDYIKKIVAKAKIKATIIQTPVQQVNLTEEGTYITQEVSVLVEECSKQCKTCPMSFLCSPPKAEEEQ